MEWCLRCISTDGADFVLKFGVGFQCICPDGSRCIYPNGVVLAMEILGGGSHLHPSASCLQLRALVTPKQETEATVSSEPLVKCEPVAPGRHLHARDCSHSSFVHINLLTLQKYEEGHSGALVFRSFGFGFIRLRLLD